VKGPVVGGTLDLAAAHQRFVRVDVHQRCPVETGVLGRVANQLKIKEKYSKIIKKINI
jgi:hypothetical protein